MSLQKLPRLLLPFVVLFVGFFVVAAAHSIARPGLYYDEVIFAPVSFQTLDGKDILAPVGLRLFGWPVTQLPPYVGALKAYLMAPILGLFGSSYLTLRLPMILVVAFSIWLMAGFVGRRISAIPTLAVLALSVIDPAIIYTTKTDWGPTSLAALFRLLALGFFIRFAETRQTRDMAVVLVACALGLWDKSNFAWLMIALAAAGMIFYWRAILDWLAGSYNQAIPLLVGFVFVYGLVFFGSLYRPCPSMLQPIR